jgi:hypothetical protein
MSALRFVGCGLGILLWGDLLRPESSTDDEGNPYNVLPEMLLAFAVTGAVGTLAVVDLFDAPRSAVRANTKMNMSLVPLVARYSSDAADDAVQANIVAAGYGR